jgi:hypothetical protein
MKVLACIGMVTIGGCAILLAMAVVTITWIAVLDLLGKCV